MWLAAIGPLLFAAALQVVVSVAADSAATAAAASAGTASSAPHAHHHHQQQQQVAGGSVGIAAAQSWIPYRHSALSLQGVQSVLLSIEERLRSLDASVYSSRYAPRWEMSLEQQGRRLEAVESRLGRLETLLEIRLDKLAESVSSRQLKEELSKDQMTRKFDSAYERLNHRLGYMEARLDVGVSKLQSSVEMASDRVEAAVRGRQSGASTDAALLDLSVNVADLRRRVDDCQARSNDTVAAMASSSAHRLEAIASSLAQLRYDFNRTLAAASSELHDASDQAPAAPLPHPADYVDKVVVAMEKQVSNLASKVTNMYNELWRRTQVLETLTKDSMTLSNATRRELQDGLRSLSRRGAYHADREKQDTVGSLQESMDVLAGMVHRRMSELGRKLDSSFQMLMLAQNLFLESCHRLQLEEPQLEAKLTAVLGSILDTLHNKSASTVQEVQQVHEMLKSHHSHVVRTVAHNTNTVMKAAEEARNQARQIERNIQEVTEALSAAGKDHAATLRHGHDAVDTRLANILGTLQDLQDQLGEMVPDNSDTSREIMNAEACLGNQKTLTRIASEIEKHNTLLVKSLEDRSAVITCPSIDIPEFTNRIALTFEEKGIVACKATVDSNDVSQIIQPYEKSHTSDKNIFTHTSGHHNNGSKSNDISGQHDEVWDKTKEDVLSTSDGKRASLTTSSKIYPLNDSNLNDVTEHLPSDSGSLFKTEWSTGNSEASTSENSVSQIEEQHSNSSQSKWRKIVAIIHDADTGGGKEVQKPSITIIHEKSSEDKTTEFSSSFHIPDAVHDQHDSNTSLLSRTPTEQDIQVIAFLRRSDDDETAEKENGSNVMRRSMNYVNNSESVNTTTFAEESSASHANSGSVTTTGTTEHVKQNDEMEDAFTMSTKIVNYTNASNFIKSEHNVTSNESYNLETNFTNSGPNTVDQEHNTELYVSEFLKKLMETYGTDKQVNKSIQDFWKVLLEKNHHIKTDKHSVENGTTAELLDTSKEEPNEDSSYDEDDYGNYKNLDFHDHRLNISTIPETINDVKIKQYVNKLEEIAHELSSRKESSLNNSTVSSMNYTHILTEQQYLPAQLTEEDDMSSYQ